MFWEALNPFIKKILRILIKFSDFQNVFLSKYSDKNFQKSVQPAAPKYFVWEFLRFSKKICGFKILRFFSEFRFLLRIKPRKISWSPERGGSVRPNPEGQIIKIQKAKN